MKKSLLLIIMNIVIISNFVGQTTYTSENDVFNSKSFTFYGYDYTKLRVADPTRAGQNLMPFFPALTKLLLGDFNQKEFEIIFKKGKGNVPFNTVPTTIENEKINNGKIVSSKHEKIPSDSLPMMLKKYQLTEKEGIGSVIIYECFDREAQTISAYMVFFDISTRNILYSKHIDSKDGNGYNYMADWKKASLKAIPRLLDLCADDFDAYKKAQKGAIKK